MPNTGPEDFELEAHCTKCRQPLRTEVYVFNMNGRNNQFCSRSCMVQWAARKNVDALTIQTLKGE